jgi:hypothetical protein
MNRAFNFVLSLVGLAVLAYALFLLDRNAWVASSALPVGLAGWGGALFLLAFGYATCGHRSAGYLTVYALLNLAFFLANGALLGYTFSHADQVIDYLNATLVSGRDVPESWMDAARATLQLGELGVGGVSVAVLLAAAVALCQRASLQQSTEIEEYRRFGDDGYGDEEYDYGYTPPNAAAAVAGSGRSAVPGSGGRRGSGRDTDRATSRFRDKYSDMYDKYNIQTG